MTDIAIKHKSCHLLVKSRIANGSFGSVYRAEMQPLGNVSTLAPHRAALKFMRQKDQDALREEWKVLQKVGTHPIHRPGHRMA